MLIHQRSYPDTKIIVWGNGIEMRLFIAINFSVEMKKTLADLINHLKKQRVKANFTAPENLHLTLVFVGETESEDLIIKSIEKLSVPPFEITLENHGSFGDILWVGIRSEKLLSAYVKNLKYDLQLSGFDIKDQKFTPHITLARRAILKDELDLNIPATSMRVSRISLMKSESIDAHLNYSEIYAKILTENW